MKHTLSIITFTLCLQFCYGQADSSKIFTAPVLKKGFYKNYKEFVNNAPSLTNQFTVIPLAASKKEPIIIGAQYKLDDSTQSVEDVWGFCDGKYVYVHYSSYFFKELYWKLEYIGHYSFFTIKHNYMAPIIASAAHYDLIVIDDDGNFKEPTTRLMRKWLKKVPDLLKQFDAETIQDATRNTKEYLYELSEALNRK